MISDYIHHLGELRWQSLELDTEPLISNSYLKEPESMQWVKQYSDANFVKTDFFEAKVTAYAKSTAIEDDL